MKLKDPDQIQKVRVHRSFSDKREKKKNDFSEKGGEPEKKKKNDGWKILKDTSVNFSLVFIVRGVISVIWKFH